MTTEPAATDIDERRKPITVHARSGWWVLATDSDGVWFHGAIGEEWTVREMTYRNEADARKAWAPNNQR
jgi:hypothetical protein